MSPLKFHPDMPFKPGFIAGTKEGAFSSCRLGGVAWTASGSRPDLGFPVLLVTITLSDLALNLSTSVAGNIEIPLFSYINLAGVIPQQEYQLDFESKSVKFKPFAADVELLAVEDRLETPLPETPLRLRQMREGEIPVDERSYWTAMDSFLGGESTIRICGAPAYIDYIAPNTDGFSYFASVGYEPPGCVGGLISNATFFLGELAHYFFISSDLKTVRVVAQPS